MASKYDELLEHEYDGIREYDNPLPRWWMGIFLISIVFSVIYVPYYYLGYGPTSVQMWEEEVAEAKAMQGAKAPAASAAAPGGSDTSGSGGGAPAQQAAVASLEGDAGAIAEGKNLFAGNCAPCHGPQGQGLIGPNLTDNHWLHGNTYADVVRVITDGVPDKGMVPWKSTLNPTKIQQVAAFVMSLGGSNPANAKPPQGTEYK